MRYTLFLLLLIVSSCGQPESKEKASYVDLKSFFELEAQRLSKSNPKVIKTVAHNDARETRSVKDINWESELSLFTESDLNKPAWRDSYKVITSGADITYMATDSTLKTREIQINKDSEGRIHQVTIRNRTSNMLYTSSEQLLYIRDSIYQINKQQDVFLLGENRYGIKGLFGQ